MADLGRWFKLWCTAVHDPDLDNLPIDDFGRWAKLGAFIKEHGTEGKVALTPPSKTLCTALQVETFEELISCCKRLPKLNVSSETLGGVSFFIEFRNWRKYQDNLSTPRVHKHREKKRQSETPKRRGEERRREEKRTEEKPQNTHTVGSDEPTGFVTFWKLYPEPKGSKAQALKAFRTVHPPETIAGILQAQLLHKIACDKAGVFWPRFPHACRYLSHRRWTDEIPQALATGAQAPEATPPADAKARWNSREEYAVARKAGRVPLPERVVEWENSNTPST